MLIIFTGNGKGKTTAALGQAMRALGNGSKVLMVQFIKGPWESGEHVSCKKFGKCFQITKKGKGFVGIGNDTLPRSTHIKVAEEGLAFAEQEVKNGKWNILILDEICNAITLGLLTPKKVFDFIKNNAPKLDHIIMTGRDCPQEFIDIADLVTEMKEIKHPFSKGVIATKGVEF